LRSHLALHPVEQGGGLLYHPLGVLPQHAGLAGRGGRVLELGEAGADALEGGQHHARHPLPLLVMLLLPLRMQQRTPTLATFCARKRW
jgi:hypothetical protein